VEGTVSTTVSCRGELCALCGPCVTYSSGMGSYGLTVKEKGVPIRHSTGVWSPFFLPFTRILCTVFNMYSKTGSWAAVWNQTEINEKGTLKCITLDDAR